MTSLYARHRSLVLALNAALLSIGAAHAGEIAKPSPLHDFMEVRISPDGRNVVSIEGESSTAGGAPVVRDLVIRSSDGKDTTAIALPCGRVAQCWPSSPVWTPDSTKITFALRAPGSHARSLYQIDANGKNLTQLLSFNGTINALAYNGDGQLAMLATENATKELGAVEAGAPVAGDLDAAPPEQRIAVLEQGKLNWASPADMFVYEYDWRPDGKGFVGTAAHGDGDNNWWIAKLYAFAGSQAQLLYTPASAQQQLAVPRVSRDGKQVAFIGGIMSDFGSTGGDVYTLPLKGAKAEDNIAPGAGATNLTPHMPASASAIAWDCNGHLVARLLVGDRTEVAEIGSAGSKAGIAKTLWQGQETPSGGRGALTGECPSGVGARIHESFARAAEIEIGSGNDWHDLTRANGGQVAPFKVQSLSWNSDGMQVQGWLILPENIAVGRKLPLVVIVHGGPAAAVQSRFIGDGIARALLEHGYAILEPNPRGSYGQGEAFTAANVRDFGYGDLRDILAGVDKAVASAPIDAERVGITGHSYGGFMTMWTVTQTNRFKAAVASAGISNWQSYYGENGIDQWMIPYFGASVYDDPAVYAKSSAINFIKNVRTPTLSMVGAADIECPAPQTQEFGHAMKAFNLPSSTIIYPGEGHRFNNPEHLADHERRTLEWFDRYLK